MSTLDSTGEPPLLEEPEDLSPDELRRRNRFFVPVAGAVLFTFLFYALGFVASWDRAFGDLRNALLEQRIESDVVIVAVDAESLRQLNRWPWGRDVHARVLQQIDRAEPQAVFFDIDFSVASGNADADRLLTNVFAAKRDYPLILPMFWQERTAASERRRVLTEPLSGLAQHAKAGLVNVYPENDGLVRRAIHIDRFGSRDLVSASALIAKRQDLRPGHFYPIDFSISPRSFDYVSYVDVLNGRVSPAHFRNKNVFIGATAIELGDNIPVPVHRALPGVVLQGLMYETLRRGVPVPASLGLFSALGFVLILFSIRYLRLGWRGQFGLMAAFSLSLAITSLGLKAAYNIELDIALLWVLGVATLFANILANADRQAVAAFLATLSLRREQALVSEVLAASIDGIVVIDLAGEILEANPAALKLLDLSLQEARGSNLRTHLPDLAPVPEDPIEPGRHELVLRDGAEDVQIEVTVSPGGERADALMPVILRDVRERHRQQAILRHQATHDVLTGLPNRALLNRNLQRLDPVSRAALFMLDLDGFKQINDTLGHRVGDQILRELGKRLRGTLPRDVRIFRIGGDEFAVLIEGYTPREGLLELSADILRRVRMPFEVVDTRIELGGSIGVALYPQHAKNGDLLLQCADVAMYTAKRARSGTEFYDPGQDHNTLRNLAMTGALREALRRRELTMVYQPKICLETGRCLSVEALTRWEDSALGVVGPSEFIPVAEACDLIAPLTLFTLERALRDHASWSASGVEVSLSVNLSARHVGDADFVEQIIECVDASGIDPARLELEITETALMENPDRAQSVLTRLTNHGMRLAIDDFGTGFSSLAYLKHLNLSTLKIDRCFVQDLCVSRSDQKIVDSTLRMAHSLDMQVVAEGVETTAQLDQLVQLGCDMAQGYVFARPMEPAQFIRWLNGGAYRANLVPRAESA